MSARAAGVFAGILFLIFFLVVLAGCIPESPTEVEYKEHPERAFQADTVAHRRTP